MPLDRASILARADRANLPKESVSVPEWGDETVYVRAMTGAERDKFETENEQAKGSGFRARLLLATLCDESGALLFTPDDAAAVGSLDSNALNRLMVAALRINKLRKVDVEDLEKNLNATP